MEELEGASAPPEAGSGPGVFRQAASTVSAASFNTQLAGASFVTAVDDSETAAGAEAPAAAAAAAAPPPAAEPGTEAPALRPLRSSPEASASSEPPLADPKHSASTKLRRVQQRNDQLRRLFSLPATEALVEDFSCALKKKMLLQGRMYVFEEHICFYTNLFGYVKLKCIPLSEVSDVKKMKNVGFANSIEVTWGPNNKREFFTSFLHRGEAYRLIMAQWRQCSDLAPPSPVAPQQPAADSSVQASGLSGRTKRLLRGMGSLVSRSSLQCGEDGGGLRSSVSGTADSISFLAGLPPLESLAEEAPLPEGMAPAPASSSGGEEGSGLGAEPSFASRRQLGCESSFVVLDGSPGAAGSAATSTQSSPVRAPRPVNSDAAEVAGGGKAPQYTLEFQAVSDQQLQRELENDLSSSTEPAPAVDAALQPVLDFDLGCTPLQFWGRFLSNASDFLVRFHESRGDSAIRLGKWTRHYKVGLVRDLQFITPVKAKIGPPQAMCHQTQRLQVFAGQHIVLETSQVMSEIPYSDHFSVETRWDIVPGGEGGCHVTMRAKVPFSKATMWKKFIEKGSMDQLLESMQAYSKMAATQLAAEPLASRPSSFTHHARRHSRVASVSSSIAAGVPVGRQPAVLSRHRRRASHVTDAMAAAAVEAAPSPRTLEQQKQQLAAVREGPPPPAVQRLALAAFGALTAVLAWLASRTAAAARAAWAHPGHLLLCCIGCVIVAMQVALLLEHRQEHRRTPMPDAAAATALSVAGPEAAAQAAATLRREVANLQQTLQQLHMQGEAWQDQLQNALASAAELAQRLPQHAWGDGPA